MINRLKLGISNIKYWLKVIWKDRQDSEDSIYKLELKKIQRMLGWWNSGESITEKELVLRDLKICEYLLKVILQKIDYIVPNSDCVSFNKTKPSHKYLYKFNHYVNIRNRERFIKDCLDMDKNSWMHLDILYTEKCKNLYYLIRKYRTETWWD